MGSEMIVAVGVGTHADVHVAAVLGQAGQLLATGSFPVTTRGYAQLATWAESFGTVDRVGVEGTGHFGAGLLRFLADYGLAVVEVDRPDLSARRRHTQPPNTPAARAHPTPRNHLTNRSIEQGAPEFVSDTRYMFPRRTS